MNTLHLLIAFDLGFALFVWWVYRDHNKKMDALYEKYDTEHKKKWGSILDEPDSTEIIKIIDKK